MHLGQRVRAKPEAAAAPLRELLRHVAVGDGESFGHHPCGSHPLQVVFAQIDPSHAGNDALKAATRICESDYFMIMDLLAAEGLGPDGSFYDTEGMDVIVAERLGRVVGVAEYSLDCDFGDPRDGLAIPASRGGSSPSPSLPLIDAAGSVRRCLPRSPGKHRRPAGHLSPSFLRTATMRRNARHSSGHAGSL